MENPELYMEMQRLKLTTIEEFTKLSKNTERIKFCCENSPKHEQVSPVSLGKCEMKAAIARKKGNTHFAATEYSAALTCYNESLCFAPAGSQSIGIAYANRSQIYLKSGFYRLCLENIDLALEHGYPRDLQPKLLERREACRKRLHCQPSTVHAKLSYPANPEIHHVFDALRVERNQKYGRHILTSKQLQPGDVVLIEKPFIQTLDASVSYGHCFNCLAHSYHNLQPCPRSTKVMWCSQKCMDEAWSRFYKYIHPVIDELLETLDAAAFCAVAATLKAFANFDDPRQLMKTEDETNFNAKNEFKTFFSLVTNETNLDSDVLYEMSRSCANAWTLMKNLPELKVLLKGQEELFLELLLRSVMIINANSHVINPNQIDIGTGVSLISSLINHSCSPNVTRVHCQDKLVLVVIRPIKPGQQIFISYGPTYAHVNRLERRKKLQLRYSFYCKCDACERGYELSCNLQRKNSISVRAIENIKKANETGCYTDELLKIICERSTSSDHLHPCWDTQFLHESLGKAMYEKFSPMVTMSGSKRKVKKSKK